MVDRIAVGAIVLAVLAFAPAAGAAVTASTVTSPADGAGFDVDLDSPGQIVVTGTATAANPETDQVRIVCTYFEDPDGTAFALTPAATGGLTPTGPDTGTFSVEFPADAIDYFTCRLRAVPAGPLPLDYRPFSGPVTHFSGRYTIPAGGPAELHDFYQDIAGPLAYWDGSSTSNCFLWSTYTLDPATLGYEELFNCARVAGGDPTGTRASLQVDGRDAFLPFEAFDSYETIAGGLPITGLARRLDPASGDVRLTASEPVVRCADGSTTYPPDCPAWEDAGLSNRTTTVGDHGGRLVRHTDVWTNSGSATRQLDVWYELNMTNPADQWQFPGETAYAPRADGDTILPPGAGPASALVAYDPALADYQNPRGSVTWSAPPSEIEFTASNELYLRYVRTVPAGGAVAISHTFATDGSQASVDALSADARAGLRPAIAITAPADGAIFGTAAATVTGIATDDGPVSVNVNGHPAAVAGNGAWTVAVPLRHGPNQLVATATDTDGNSVAAQRTVTLATPGPPPPPGPPSNQFTLTVKKPRPGARALKVTVTVPGPGAIRTRLTASIRRTGRTVTLAKATKTARSAGKVRLTVRLSKKARRLLRTHRVLKARLSARYRPIGGTARTKTKRVTLRTANSRPATNRHSR